MKIWLKEAMTTNYKMEVLKTTVGNHLSNMFLETVAFNIAIFWKAARERSPEKNMRHFTAHWQQPNERVKG